MTNAEKIAELTEREKAAEQARDRAKTSEDIAFYVGLAQGYQMLIGELTQVGDDKAAGRKVCQIAVKAGTLGLPNAGDEKARGYGTALSLAYLPVEGRQTA